MYYSSIRLKFSHADYGTNLFVWKDVFFKISFWTNKNANSIHSTLFTTDPEYYIFMKPVQQFEMLKTHRYTHGQTGHS
jgi:hypothetical protein